MTPSTELEEQRNRIIQAVDRYLAQPGSESLYQAVLALLLASNTILDIEETYQQWTAGSGQRHDCCIRIRHSVSTDRQQGLTGQTVIQGMLTELQNTRSIPPDQHFLDMMRRYWLDELPLIVHLDHRLQATTPSSRARSATHRPDEEPFLSEDQQEHLRQRIYTRERPVPSEELDRSHPQDTP